MYSHLVEWQLLKISSLYTVFTFVICYGNVCVGLCLELLFVFLLPTYLPVNISLYFIRSSLKSLKNICTSFTRFISRHLMSFNARVPNPWATDWYQSTETFSALSVKNLSSTKPVPDDKKVGDCWFHAIQIISFKFFHFPVGLYLKYRNIINSYVLTLFSITSCIQLTDSNSSNFLKQDFMNQLHLNKKEEKLKIKAGFYFLHKFYSHNILRMKKKFPGN